MSDFGPTVPSSGPRRSNILILGEAPGSEETERGKPFVGPSGHELRRMLRTLGIDMETCLVTNTFSRQPANNNIALYGAPGRSDCLRHLGPLTVNPITYLDPAHAHELDRLYAEIATCRPNVIVALGNTACWALGLGQGIGALRGSIHTAQVPGMDRAVKVLPTYHPAAVLRQWDQRTIALADLEKAHVESHSPEFSYDNTELWLSPTLDDIQEFDAIHMATARVCAADIETKRGQITCLSFAPSVSVSLVIPFWIEGPEPSYWTPSEEAVAWRYVQRWMERADLIKVFQNGLFDLQYLSAYCNPRSCTADTMLMHHSLFSELRKGLGFLGSVYANYPSWKFMRTFKVEEQLKRDD